MSNVPGSLVVALGQAAAFAIGGLLIGAYFGVPWLGLSLALGATLVWHLQRLAALERTLRERRRVEVPDGDGIWSRVLAGIHYQQQRVRRHKKRHRQLMKELRQSTNALPDGVIALTADNEIQRYNAAAQMLVGLRRRRDRGQRIDNLIRHPDFLDYLHAGEFASPVIVPSTTRDDGWLSLTLVPYSDNGRLLIIRDVTERTRLSRMRRDFVANASHELRTPLTVITGYLDAMQADESSLGEWHKPLLEMDAQARRMGLILNELLALSRLEASATASREHALDVGALIRDCVAPYVNKAHDIDVRVDSDRLLLGEIADLISVITNLVTNAIRYSADGSRITLCWRARASGEGVLSVADTGVGIDGDDIPRLTERFFRVNRGRERDSGGIGLGLAIVKHALMRHEAQLEIDSELGAGSCFSCVFPADRLVAPVFRLDQEAAAG